MSAPFLNGTPQQGNQSSLTPATRYRQALAALDKYCRAAFSGRPFVRLSEEEKDKLLAGLENNSIKLDGGDGKAFFQQVLINTREGFFADPIYGGNRDMVGWKVIGFAGARYDYRDWIGKKALAALGLTSLAARSRVEIGLDVMPACSANPDPQNLTGSVRIREQGVTVSYMRSHSPLTPSAVAQCLQQKKVPLFL